MFLGTHTPKLDDKGRLILPAKYRDELADGLVITRFQERCLAIWPISAFDEVTKTARSASSSQQDVRDYQRMLASGASDEVPDKQGRITIPPHLRSYAGLDRDCVGGGDRTRRGLERRRMGAVLRREGAGVCRTEPERVPRRLRARQTEGRNTARVERLQPAGSTPRHNFPGAR